MQNVDAILSVIGGDCFLMPAMTGVSYGQCPVAAGQGRSRERMRKRRAFSLIKPSASA